MAAFINVFYPGNKQRQERIDQLTANCSIMLADAAQTKTDVEKELEKCDQLIKEVYGSLAKAPPKLEKVNLTNEWAFYVPSIIIDALGSTLAVSALRWAWSTYLVRAGKITAEQLTALGAKSAIRIVVPAWLSVVSELGVSLAATAVLDMLVDSITGAVQRDELINGIHQITETRVGMKQTELHNRSLIKLLSAVTLAFEAIKSLAGTGLVPEEAIDQMVKNMLDTHKMEADSITRAAAVKSLMELDADTPNCYTKDDGDWATKTVAGGRMLLSARDMPALTPAMIAQSAIQNITCIPAQNKELLLQAVRASA